MKIGILGAGLTNFAASYEIIIFERNAMAGGCLTSENYGEYTLETLYHHCFSGDARLFPCLKSSVSKRI